MTHIPILSFERRERDRVVAGVCGGVADALGVDPTLVRLVFALLALAGGAGILLYFALWVWTSGRRPVLAVLILAAATMALLQSLGVPTAVVIGAGLMVGGIVLLARRGATLRPGGSRLFVPGIALAMAGAVLMLSHLGSSRPIVGPGALAGALALVLGPWLWQLAAERTERIRLAERAAMAARIHDSVLQTLALVQRDADDAPRVRALARRQERELRRWLYGRGYDGATTVADALADAVAEVEEAHLTQIELATSGDAPLDSALGELVLAAREAMVNAAKHAQSDEISVYAEVENAAVAIYVRDRGVGFDQAAVPAGRRGIAESIEGRVRTAGGSATITSSPGDGTEVELTMPRGGEA
ncbi:MAG TPA: PspC domain-containing protein [Gaiellaceae bacterium]|nr:PspC domain-containing protein [Gaiellaceae bacterium]